MNIYAISTNICETYTITFMPRLPTWLCLTAGNSFGNSCAKSSKGTRCKHVFAILGRILGRVIQGSTGTRCKHVYGILGRACSEGALATGGGDVPRQFPLPSILKPFGLGSP